MTDMTVEELVERFGLAPLPLEGGFFVETWRGEEHNGRPAGTSILVLLAAAQDQFSALHRLPVTEVWHYHLGDPIEMLLLHPDGSSEVAWLGPEIGSGHLLQQVVPAAHGWGPAPAREGAGRCSEPRWRRASSRRTTRVGTGMRWLPPTRSGPS
jgi:hypothetical protein